MPTIECVSACAVAAPRAHQGASCCRREKRRCTLRRVQGEQTSSSLSCAGDAMRTLARRCVRSHDPHHRRTLTGPRAPMLTRAGWRHPTAQRRKERLGRCLSIPCGEWGHCIVCQRRTCLAVGRATATDNSRCCTAAGWRRPAARHGTGTPAWLQERPPRGRCVSDHGGERQPQQTQLATPASARSGARGGTAQAGGIADGASRRAWVCMASVFV